MEGIIRGTFDWYLTTYIQSSAIHKINFDDSWKVKSKNFSICQKRQQQQQENERKLDAIKLIKISTICART